MYRDSLCPLCGGPVSECQTPATLEDFRDGRFDLEQVRCMRTYDLRKEMARVQETADQPESFVWVSKLRGDEGG